MRNERGITLVALIISVVIMLILAVVVIAYALGDTGIFENTGKAKIMNKVQALDDAIKAYSVKADDAYSTERKTADDLCLETFIDKNNQQQTVLQKIEIEDDKTVYVVNFDESGKVAELLGLKPDDFKLNAQNLLKKVPSPNGKYSLSQLKDLGIYVVDHDLNAAYLYDGTTYGKLINFGVKEVIAEKTEYTSQYVKLFVNNVQRAAKQEVVLVVDITPSMAYKMTGGDYIAYSKVSIEDGYNQTRWANTVVALNAFIEEYLKNQENKDKSVTVILFAGDNDAGSTSIKRVCTNVKTISGAKGAYNSIFTLDHYTNIMNYGTKWSAKSDPKKNTNYTIGPQYKKTTYYDQYYGKIISSNASLKNSTPVGFGGNTCGPNALLEAYTYVQDAIKEDSTIQRDVIMLTDGESNVGWGSYKVIKNGKETTKTLSQNNCTYAMGEIGHNIAQLESGNRNVGVYAVGVSSDISKLKDYFGSEFSGNIFEATKASDIVDSFQKILENIKTNTEGSTDVTNNHTIVERDTFETIAYEGVDTIQVVMKRTDTNETINIIFGVGKDYDLEEVYDTETGIIKLEKAWEYSGLSPSELDLYNDKEIYITTINNGN